jgi:hypothetical protein
MGDVTLSAEEVRLILEVLPKVEETFIPEDVALRAKLEAAIKPARPEPTYERWWVTAGSKDLAHGQHVLDWADWMADHADDAEVLVPESLLLEALAKAAPEHYIERLEVVDADSRVHCSCGWYSTRWLQARNLASAFQRHLEEAGAA